MPQPGDQIGPYRLVSTAGEGGMGVVYRAADTLLHDRAVAVKVMAAHLSRQDAYRAAFLHEAQVAAEVNHPHVVPVHAAGEADGLLYLAMAWIDGVDLGTLRDEGIGPARSVDITQQIARALQALHDAGIVHGDVKPTNVIVHRAGGEDHAYLVDFGVARRTEFADPHTNELVGGTPAYAAPETLDGPPGPLTDQYALACVLYELLTGAKPFGSGEPAVLLARHASAPRPRVSESVPGLAYLDAPVARAMAVDPADRYPDAATFGRELAAAQRRAADEPTQARIATPRGPAADDDDTQDVPVTAVVPAAPPRARVPTPTPAPRRRRRWPTLLAVVLLAAVAAAVVLVVTSAGNGGTTTKQPSASAIAAAQKRSDQIVVARLVRHYAHALNTQNLTLLARVVDPDVVRKGSDGVRGTCVTDKGSRAALKRWKSELPGIPSYRITGDSAKKIDVTGDQATLLAKFAIGGQHAASVRFNARKRDNVWRVTRVLLPPCNVT
jgi:predicted Ser/Thr protein kinase